VRLKELEEGRREEKREIKKRRDYTSPQAVVVDRAPKIELADHLLQALCSF
jgi:hypothetical protein